MNHSLPKVHQVSHGKINGASPSEDRFYTLIFYDISDAKKYRCLVKILKSYGTRVQKSVFEAQLKQSQIKELSTSIERLMLSKAYYNADDSVQIFRISGNCESTVYGFYNENILEDSLFF